MVWKTVKRKLKHQGKKHCEQESASMRDHERNEQAKERARTDSERVKRLEESVCACKKKFRV